MSDEQIRLQKYMSECGIASRRSSEKLIAAGKVRVNGKTASIGDKIDPSKDKVEVSGKPVTSDETPRYIMLNKPRGFITTMNDEQDRKCVASLISDCGQRVYPVGRLDRESEGLLIFTNDGELANALMHPSRAVTKTYIAVVRPHATEAQMTALATGVMIDGRMAVPAKVTLISSLPDRDKIEMVLCEGRNREVRRICEDAGLTVIRLKRVSEGPLLLGSLPAGKYRDLTDAEVKSLRKAAGI